MGIASLLSFTMLGIYVSQIVQEFEDCQTGSGVQIHTKIPHVFQIGTKIVSINIILITLHWFLWLKVERNGGHQGH